MKLFQALFSLALFTAPLVDAVGEPNQIDPSEIDSEITDFALSHLEASTNNYFSRRIVSVKDATMQIVSGYLYTFTLELGKTECRKPSEGDLIVDEKKCKFQAATPTEDCQVSVWSKPWENFLKLTKFKCSKNNGLAMMSRKKRSVSVPGFVSISSSDESHDNLDQQDVNEILKSKLRELSSNERSRAELKSLQSHSNFKKFMKKFKRSYESKSEYKRRYKIFRENMKIVQFLRETEQASGEYGVTQFADYSEEEKKQVLGLRPEWELPGSLPELDESEYLEDIDDLPEEFDWTEHGAVTPVKNQGTCGSCWAFSVTGNVEGQWFLKTKKLISLSEQELVDCDRTDNGCNGGLPSNAYKAIVKLGGLESESEYSYEGMNEKCKFNKSEVRATIKGGVALTKNETLLQNWLVKNGPISIGINANAMMFYYGGVSHPWKFLCRSKGIDHGVLIVGYGTVKLPSLKDQPYWKIKNSWGTSWGESGYYRVWRGDGTCGVNQMATSSVV